MARTNRKILRTSSELHVQENDSVNEEQNRNSPAEFIPYPTYPLEFPSYCSADVWQPMELSLSANGTASNLPKTVGPSIVFLDSAAPATVKRLDPPPTPSERIAFRRLIRVLLKHLEKNEPKLWEEAVEAVELCAEPDAELKRRLKHLVGDDHWKKAEVYLARILHDMATYSNEPAPTGDGGEKKTSPRLEKLTEPTDCSRQNSGVMGRSQSGLSTSENSPLL